MCAFAGCTNPRGHDSELVSNAQCAALHGPSQRRIELRTNAIPAVSQLKHYSTVLVGVVEAKHLLHAQDQRTRSTCTLLLDLLNRAVLLLMHLALVPIAKLSKHIVPCPPRRSALRIRRHVRCKLPQHQRPVILYPAERGARRAKRMQGRQCLRSALRHAVTAAKRILRCVCRIAQNQHRLIWHATRQRVGFGLLSRYNACGPVAGAHARP